MHPCARRQPHGSSRNGFATCHGHRTSSGVKSLKIKSDSALHGSQVCSYHFGTIGRYLRGMIPTEPQNSHPAFNFACRT
jgi:hypothetical protein